MKKVDKTVLKETRYIASFVLIFSVLTQAIFLIIGKWDYTVLLGNILSGGVAIMNFFLMGITVQSAVNKEDKEARGTMKMSQSLRTLLLFAAAALGVLLPCFHTVTSLIPLFFPRIAIAFKPLFLNREKEDMEK